MVRPVLVMDEWSEEYGELGKLLPPIHSIFGWRFLKYVGAVPLAIGSDFIHCSLPAVVGVISGLFSVSFPFLH